MSDLVKWQNWTFITVIYLNFRLKVKILQIKAICLFPKGSVYLKSCGGIIICGGRGSENVWYDRICPGDWELSSSSLWLGNATGYFYSLSWTGYRIDDFIGFLPTPGGDCGKYSYHLLHHRFHVYVFQNRGGIGLWVLREINCAEK